jgi:ankyrin repeat protein
MLVSQEDRTALMWAAINGHTDVINALIEKGAYVNAKEKVRLRFLSVEEKMSVFEYGMEIYSLNTIASSEALYLTFQTTVTSCLSCNQVQHSRVQHL